MPPTKQSQQRSTEPNNKFLSNSSRFRRSASQMMPQVAPPLPLASQQTIRKKKGLIVKKIPSEFTNREYDTNEMSSKWDVKGRSSAFDKLDLTAADEKRFDSKIPAAFLSSNGKNTNSTMNATNFFWKDDDYEEENTKKMVIFSYHGRHFQYCKESCQLFKKEHRIRRLAVWIIEWNLYKQITVVMITAMAVFMGLHNYVVSEDELRRIGGYQSIFSYSKIFFIVYFAIEIVLKIIAKGLYQAHNSYLRNINNWIILIVFGIIAIYDSEFIFLLIFRIFYVFEFTNRFKYLKHASVILKLYSFSGETICKLVFLIFFFITIFGILSINIWSGIMDYRCRTVPAPLLGDWPIDTTQERLCGGFYSCNENTYCGSNYEVNMSSTSYIDANKMDDPINLKQFQYGITNFDNLLQSYLSLFQIFMVEGFTNIHYMMQDSHDAIIPIIFIIVYLLVLTYFFNDLIIAVFFSKYQLIDAEENKKKKKRQQQPSLPTVAATMNKLKQSHLNSTAVSAINGGNQGQLRKLTSFEKQTMKGDQKKKSNQLELDSLTQLSLGEKKKKSNLLSRLKASDIIASEAANKTRIAPEPKSEAQSVFQHSMKMESMHISEANLNRSSNSNLMKHRVKPRAISKMPYSSKSNSFASGFGFGYNKEWNSTIKSVFERVLSSKLFTIMINSFIFINMCILSFDKYPAINSSALSALHYVHLMLIVIFMIEDIMRVFTLQKTNDIVFLVLEIIVDITSLVVLINTHGFTPISSLKGMRILYALTSVKSWVNYRILIDAIDHSISYVLNIMLIAFFFMYLGTVIGMWLFGGKLKFTPDDKLDLVNGQSPRFNFDDLLSAFTSVFSAVQGDYWNNIWMDCVRSVGGWKSHTFFILLMISGKLLFVNSFISIMLNSFEYAKHKADQAQRGAKALIDQLRNMSLKKKVHPELQFLKSPLKPITSPVLMKSPELLHITKEKNLKKEFTRSLSMKPDTLQKPNKLPEALGKRIVLKLKQVESNQSKEVESNTNSGGGGGDNSKQQNTRKLQKATTMGSKSKRGTHHAGELPFSAAINEFSAFSRFKRSVKMWVNKRKACSLFVFPPNSAIRQLIMRMISSSYWDNFFLVQIVLSSLQLAFDNPLDDQTSTFQVFMGVLDDYFMAIFVMEMICQIIAFGFIFNKSHPNRAFIRSMWNILDLIINITSIMDVSGTMSTNLKSLRSLRAVRALRPLRILTKDENLRLLINAFLQTIPLMSSLVFVTISATWIFAIFLMSSFKGKFEYCSKPDILTEAATASYKLIKDATMCVAAGGTWKNQDYNFDNIFMSILSIFKIILGEGWPSLMWSSVDGTKIEEQPIRDYSRVILIFFLFLIFMGNTYTLNLFTGLVVTNFKSLKNEISGYNALSPIQRQWVEIQKFMMKRKLKVVLECPLNNYLSICFKISMSPWFEKAMLACIIFNLATMGCTYKGISDSGAAAINIVNQTCLAIYHLEAIVKILGIGLYFYFKDDWNKFDFAVIVISDAVLLSSIFTTMSTLSSLPSILRAIRLGRLVKYIRASRSLKVLVDSVYYLLPSLVNIAVLLFLLVFICAVLGMNLFSDVMVVSQQQRYPYFSEKAVYPYQQNFQTLAGSIIIILQCVQNQNSDFYMSLYGFDQEGCYTQSYDDQQANGLKGCSSYLSFPFFLITVFFIRYIVINLFLALVVEGFIDTLHENEAVITPEILEDIIKKWSAYDQGATGFISPQDLYSLLIEIPEPIGLQSESLQLLMKQYEIDTNKDKTANQKKNKALSIPKKKIFQDLIDFNVRIYPNQKLHFMDFCIKLSRNALMSKAKTQNIEDPYLVKDRIFIEKSIMENLKRQWEAFFPGLKRMTKRKDDKEVDSFRFKVLEFYAVKVLQAFFRKSQKDKRIKNQILESKIHKQEHTKSFIPFGDGANNGLVTTVPTPLNQDNNPMESNNSSEEIHSVKPVQKAKFFQKAANHVAKSGNFFFLKRTIDGIEDKNTDSLKQFQPMHNFVITKSELGQKFPIKLATDFESLRPIEGSKKQQIKDEQQSRNTFGEGSSQSVAPVLFSLQKMKSEPVSPTEKKPHTLLRMESPVQDQINICLDIIDDFQEDDQEVSRRFSHTVVDDEIFQNTETAINRSVTSSSKKDDTD